MKDSEMGAITTMNIQKARGTPPTLKEKIYYQLFESIMRGEFQPGEIINEKSLIESFGVSKSPVREALIELCNEGVLRSIPRYGYEIIRLTDQDVHNIREYRTVLECGYFEKHWDRVTPAKVARLERAWKEDMDAGNLRTIFGHWQRNTNFHMGLISFFDNDYLTQTLQKTLRVVTRAYVQFYWNHLGGTVYSSQAEYRARITEALYDSKADYHARIVEALKAADKNKTIEYLETDLQEFHIHDTSLSEADRLKNSLTPVEET